MRIDPRYDFRRREVIANLTLKNLRTTYKDSVLGFGWSLVNPLITILVYAAVFTLILRGRGAVGDPSGLDHYGLFIAAGILPWQFGAGALTGQTQSLVSASGLLQKLYVPKWILPFSGLMSRLISFAIELVVLIVLLAAVWHVWAVKYLPFLIVVVALHAAFLFGAGLGLSVLNVYFRDTEHIVTIAMRLWFWLTPVIYPLSLIADQDKAVLGIEVETLWKLNPMLWFIESYRELLFDIRIPTLEAFGIMTAWAAGALVAGGVVYRRLSVRLVERL